MAEAIVEEQKDKMVAVLRERAPIVDAGTEKCPHCGSGRSWCKNNECKANVGNPR